MAYYQATVKVLIEANSWAEACDAMSEPMRELVYNGKTSLLDWQYVTPVNGGDPAQISLEQAHKTFDEFRVGASP